MSSLFIVVVTCISCCCLISPSHQQSATNNNNIKRQLPPCVFQYNSSFTQEGEISSPNYPSPYPNNLDCRYEFYGRENELIVLEPEDFQLESPQEPSNQDFNFFQFVETRPSNNDINRGTNNLNSETKDKSIERQCFYDFIDVFTANVDGVMVWHSRHCGNTIEKRIVSTSPTLILVFKTDRMLAYKGFKFQYSFSNLDIFPLNTEVQCGPSAITGHGGIVTSPNYPYRYEESTDCAWTISVPEGQRILVKFTDVNFAESCKHTKLSIWDGYVTDVEHPDFWVCEQLRFYHKKMKVYLSRSNRIVVNFEGLKFMQVNHELSRLKEVKQTESQTSEIFRRLFNQSMGGETEKEMNGFSLTWTAISLESDTCEGFICKGSSSCIDSGDKLCHAQNNQYCIHNSLQCDGIQHCDFNDKSDEAMCGFKLILVESKPAQLFAVVMLLTSFLVVISWRKYRTYKQIWHEKHDEKRRNKESIERATSYSGNCERRDCSLSGSGNMSRGQSNGSLSEASCLREKQRSEERTIVLNDKTALRKQQSFDEGSRHSFHKKADTSIQACDYNELNVMYDTLQARKSLTKPTENSTTSGNGCRNEGALSTFQRPFSHKSDEDTVKFIDNGSDNQKTCTSSLISMEAGGSPQYAKAESSSIRSKSKSKCLYSSVSQNEMLNVDIVDPLADEKDEEEENQMGDDGVDTRSSAMRRNSYTLAIYDNA